MTLRLRQHTRAGSLRDGSPLSVPGSGIGHDVQLVTPYRETFKFDGATLSVLAANDYGSLAFCTLPDRNLHLLAVEVDLVLTKEGNTDGIVAATDLDVGIGTAAASATTLATAMIDIIEKVDVDANALAVDFEAHSAGQSTATFPQQILDAADNQLFINAVAVGGITADSSLSVSGRIDLIWIDLGNRAS